MGSVWKRLGAEVTVVEFTNRIAGGADTEIAYVVSSFQCCIVALLLLCLLLFVVTPRRLETNFSFVLLK